MGAADSESKLELEPEAEVDVVGAGLVLDEPDCDTLVLAVLVALVDVVDDEVRAAVLLAGADCEFDVELDAD